MLVDAVNARDYPEVSGIVLVISILFVALNLAVDLLYAVLDPRVRQNEADLPLPAVGGGGHRAAGAAGAGSRR